MVWVLCLLGYLGGVELLGWIGVVAGVGVGGWGAILLWGVVSRGGKEMGVGARKFDRGRRYTGSCAMIDCNCGGVKTLLAWRNSSSVRMVEMERLI